VETPEDFTYSLFWAELSSLLGEKIPVAIVGLKPGTTGSVVQRFNHLATTSYSLLNICQRAPFLPLLNAYYASEPTSYPLLNAYYASEPTFYPLLNCFEIDFTGEEGGAFSPNSLHA